MSSDKSKAVDLITAITVGVLLAALFAFVVGLVGLATWFAAWAWSL